MWVCSLLNFVRVVSRAWSPFTWIGVVIATFRMLFYLRLCFDSIPARNQFVQVMLWTTTLEFVLIIWQCVTLLTDSS